MSVWQPRIDPWKSEMLDCCKMDEVLYCFFFLSFFLLLCIHAIDHFWWCSKLLYKWWQSSNSTAGSVWKNAVQVSYCSFCLHKLWQWLSLGNSPHYGILLEGSHIMSFKAEVVFSCFWLLTRLLKINLLPFECTGLHVLTLTEQLFVVHWFI